MPVQLCIGRAGTGKTSLCLDAIRQRLRDNAADGNRLIFLVPEQAAFQMERALIETPDLPGYSRCDVLSFRRLAHRVFNETGMSNRRPVGPMGRLMAIKLLLSRLQPEPKALRLRGSGTGLLCQLAANIEEWLQEELAPDSLKELAEQRRQDDPLAAARLEELHRLYAAYRDYLAEGRMDGAQELAVAESLIERVPWLAGAEIWVDGFAGFTALERRVLTRLAKPARSMTITLLMDPDSAVLNDRNIQPNRFTLFSRTERTAVMLRNCLQANSVEWLEPIRLKPETPPRFTSSNLARLEKTLFRTPRTKDASDGTYNDIQLIAAANRRVEVAAAVAEIQRLVRTSNGALRYRDIAVIVRDLEPYHDLLSSAMDAHYIPYFIDRRQNTAVHPLVEVLRLLPRLSQRRFNTEDIRLLLKTGLLPLNHAEADELENYVIAHGISGIEAWTGAADWTYRRLFTRSNAEEELNEAEKAELGRINQSRRRLLEPLTEWIAFSTADAVPTGHAWAGQILRTLTSLRAGETIEAWAREAMESGDTDRADVHRQVWRDTMEFLDALVDSLGDIAMTVGEVARLLDATLAELTLGLAPPMLDQVLIGSIERSRHPDLASVLLLGFHDGLFPTTPRENALLSDEERECLSAKRPAVGTTRRQRILDEKMLAYIAMTRPSRSLWISYPRADDAGRPLHPSPFIEDIRAALPGLREQSIDDPIPQRAAWPIGRIKEFGAMLAIEFRGRPQTLDEDNTAIRARWNALYEYAKNDEARVRSLTPILASLNYTNEAVLGETEIDTGMRKLSHFSASRIETFAQCPFRHFATYILKLEPRVEFEVQAIDFGNLHHKLLEEFYKQLIDEQKKLDELDEEEIQKRLAELSGTWTGKLTDEALLDNARNAFLLERSNRQLLDALRRQRLISSAGRLKPKAVEWPFGLRTKPDEPPTTAPLEIKTPGGRTIYLVGKIDRVDVVELAGEYLGAVVDYKSSNKEFRLWKVLNGINIQLLTYILALTQRGKTLAGRPIRPIAAFYLSLKNQRKSVKHPSEAHDTNKLDTEQKPHGLIDAEHLELLDGPPVTSSASPVYKVYYDKHNELGNLRYSDAYTHEEYDRIITFAQKQIGTLADRILDGDIHVHPYRCGSELPCAFCDHRPVCRFDYDTDETNDITACSRDDALTRMSEGEGTP